jgi:hypothetical protein
MTSGFVYLKHGKDDSLKDKGRKSAETRHFEARRKFKQLIQGDERKLLCGNRELVL